MPNNENFDREAYVSNYGMMNTASDMQPTPMPKTGVSPTMPYQTVYPEIYYKLQPYIMMVCDQVDTFGTAMPTQDMIEHVTDSIYDDVCKMYPDLAEYAQSNADKLAAQPVVETARFGPGPGFGWRFRRRGMFRDLIDILLLSELFRRRRRF